MSSLYIPSALVEDRASPFEVRELRQSSIDSFTTFGQWVVHKHRWNERDVQEGRAQICPLHDTTYDRDAYDQYCFGTGYLGGFSDGVLVPVSLADAQEDVFRPNQYGVLIHERNPGMKAPWTPDMGDGDMIVIVEVDPETNQITTSGDRYELREVTPTTMRGPRYHGTFNMKPYKVHQEAMTDLLPHGHPFYNVPFIFDYTNVPQPRPDDIPAGYNYTEATYSVRLVGAESSIKHSAYEQQVHVASHYETEASYGVRVVGKGGTVIIWESD
jgi:hypothetical protein